MDKIKVLLVDDHNVVREGIKELIQVEKDMEVVGEASDGSEAVLAAGMLKPDVIIMDIAMPGMNGIDATKQIKILYPTIRKSLFLRLSRPKLPDTCLRTQGAKRC